MPLSTRNWFSVSAWHALSGCKDATPLLKHGCQPGVQLPAHPRPWARGLALLRAACICAALCCGLLSARVQAQVDLPESNPEDQVTLSADAANHWSDGVYEIWVLRGNCLINQGLTYARCSEAVIWVRPGGPQGYPPHRLIAYLEGDVTIDYQQGVTTGKVRPAGSLAARVKDKTWFGRFTTSKQLAVHIGKTAGKPSPLPAIFELG